MDAVQVAADGTRFAVRHHGPPRRRRTPAALLLHGAGDTGAAFEDLAALLATDRRVIVPDRPGRGASELRGPYDPDTQASRLAALVALEEEEQSTPGPLDVVGHGEGGLVALALARARPDLVRRIVVIATPDSRSARRYAAFLLARYALDLPYSPRGRAAGLGCAPALLAGDWCGGRDARCAAALVVWGSRDRVLTERVGERLAAELASSAGAVCTTVLPGGGHAPHRESPEVIGAAVASFLRAP